MAKLKATATDLKVIPNPVNDDEIVSVVLPEDVSLDNMVLQVFGLNGSLLLRKEFKDGERNVEVPANRLAVGVNPVVVLDAEGNVVCTGKILKD